MIILDVNNLSKDFGYGQLFKDVSFSLNEGESISIVGPNGCGKSTLLKMIVGIEKIDSGTVSIKKNAKVAYLDQTGSSIKDDRKVIDILKDVFKNLNEMGERLNKLEMKLNDNLSEDEYNIILNKYCNLLEEFSSKGGYDIDVNINIVVEGLKIDKSLLNQSYDSLSGGEKTLIQLAKALMLKPDLFLLDEPTNHLDIERIEWLENYLKSFKGATIIVSHDRYFLNKMSNKILDLTWGLTKVYNTNYSGFLKEKSSNLEKQLNDYKNQQALIKRLEEQIKYFSELGMAKNSSSLCDKAHALQTQVDRIKKNTIIKPIEPKKIKMSFDEESKSSKRIIEVENLSIRLPEGKTIINSVNLTISSGEKIAILGSNGTGKSTFVKTIMGDTGYIIDGNIFIGPSVKIGYLPQIISFSNENQTLLEYFKNEVGVNEQKARQILAHFKFYKENINKKVKNLSGGEKIRVKLAELLQQKINTLIFDEPTNHIDIPTKEVLEEAIENFEGTLIFVSHDRYFINKFADKLIEFKDGKIKEYLGNYDSYKNEKVKELLKNKTNKS